MAKAELHTISPYSQAVYVSVSTQQQSTQKQIARDYTARIVERVVPLSEIEPHPENPRQHPDQQVTQLKKSHEQLGQFEPVILWQRASGYIQVKGHGYAEGVKRTPDEAVKAWILPEDTPPEVVKQIMLASNLHPMNSYDDEDILTHLLKEQQDLGTDLAALGTDDEALHQMLQASQRAHATDFLDDVLHPDIEASDDDDEEAGDGHGGSSFTDAVGDHYFQVTYALTAEQRTTVLNALKKAKQRWSVQTSNAALVQICQAFLDEGGGAV